MSRVAGVFDLAVRQAIAVPQKFVGRSRPLAVARAFRSSRRSCCRLSLSLSRGGAPSSRTFSRPRLSCWAAMQKPLVSGRPAAADFLRSSPPRPISFSPKRQPIRRIVQQLRHGAGCPGFSCIPKSQPYFSRAAEPYSIEGDPENRFLAPFSSSVEGDPDNRFLTPFSSPRPEDVFIYRGACPLPTEFKHSLVVSRSGASGFPAGEREPVFVFQSAAKVVLIYF